MSRPGRDPAGSVPVVTQVLIATDADAVYDEVDAALADDETVVSRVRRGFDVAPAVAELEPDVVLLDLHIGNMGGIAACMSLRLDAEDGRLPDVPIVLLLDRAADIFLAQRSGADAWIVKPLDAFGIRRTVAEVLEGRPAGQPSLGAEQVADVNPA